MTTASNSVENKRAAQRQRVLKTAKIYRSNGVFALETTVRDLSATGCKIVCKDQMALPNEMRIMLAADGLSCHAKVAWRKGDLAGLHFTSEFERDAKVGGKLQDGTMF